MAILDVLSTLTPPSWRGIPFPLTSLENAFTHAHVEHQFVYVDGQHIETTGRNGLTFFARIPFCNGVQPGDFEPWAGQVLYPTLFSKFLNACLDGSTGELVHPNFGPIQCKARDVTWGFKAGLRDGVELSVRWHETIDDPDTASPLTAADATGKAHDAAATLDSALDSVGPLPELSNDTSSFSDLLDAYNDGDSGLGPLHSKLDNTDAALERLDDPLLWPLQQATNDMRSALINIGLSPTSPGTGAPKTYTTQVGGSLASIGIRLGVQTDRLLTMNPSLARSPYVPANTQVRY